MAVYEFICALRSKITDFSNLYPYFVFLPTACGIRRIDSHDKIPVVLITESSNQSSVDCCIFNTQNQSANQIWSKSSQVASKVSRKDKLI